MAMPIGRRLGALGILLLAGAVTRTRLAEICRSIAEAAEVISHRW